MEENMIVNGQELVEKAEEKLAEACANLDTAIAATTPNTVTVSHPVKSHTGKNIVIGAGLVVGGGVIGFMLDHWALPKVTEAVKNHKVKKAEKKAAKEAKKAAKGKGKKQTDAAAPEKKPEPAPANEGIDPTDIDTKIDK